MKKAFLFFAFLLAAQLGFSQYVTVEVPRGSRAESTEVIDGVSTHNYATKSNIPVNGIPFMHETFQEGVLELHDGKRSAGILMRYNIAKDLFEILRGNDTLTLNRPFSVKNVYLDNKIFFFDPKLRDDAPRNQNGYFQLQTKGKLSLYIKRIKELSFDSFATHYKGGSGTKQYYYVDKVSFIGQTTEGKPFLITSTNSLISNLDAHQSEVKTFIKKNRMKLRKKEDLIKVVDFYNSL